MKVSSDSLDIFMNDYFSDYHPVSREGARKRLEALINADREALLDRLTEKAIDKTHYVEDSGTIHELRKFVPLSVIEAERREV